MTLIFFSMRNKMIINVSTGEKLGLLKHCDLKVNEETGKIEAILMPKGRMTSFLVQESEYIEIPWENIVKLGTDTILVSIPGDYSMFKYP